MKKEYRSNPNFQPGQGLIEYVSIILLMVLVSYGGLRLAGVDIRSMFEKIVSLFGQEETVYVADEFLNLASWETFQGQNCWKTENGILTTTKTSCDSRMLNKTNLPADYQVNMDMAQLLGGNGYGMMFRLTASGTSYGGYSFQIDPGYGNKFVFRRYDANGVELGKPLAVGNPPDGFNFKAPHKVSVSVKGDTFNAYVDGVMVLSAKDSTYSSGETGLRIWDSTTAKYSGFSVTQVK